MLRPHNPHTIEGIGLIEPGHTAHQFDAISIWPPIEAADELGALQQDVLEQADYPYRNPRPVSDKQRSIVWVPGSAVTDDTFTKFFTRLSLFDSVATVARQASRRQLFLAQYHDELSREDELFIGIDAELTADEEQLCGQHGFSPLADPSSLHRELTFIPRDRLYLYTARPGEAERLKFMRQTVREQLAPALSKVVSCDMVANLVPGVSLDAFRPYTL